MTGALKPDLHATIARALALLRTAPARRRGRAHADLRMTHLDDVVADIAELLGPPLQALDGGR